MITPQQARAARAILNLSIKVVSRTIPLGIRTIMEFEGGIRQIKPNTSDRLEAFYVANGIVFSRSADDVAIISYSNNPINGNYCFDTDSNIKTKTESNDILGVYEFIEEVILLKKSIEKLLDSVSFSQKAMMYIISDHKLNQKALAQALGCSPAYISAILTKKKRISQAMLDKINQSYQEIDVKSISKMEMIATKRLSESKQNIIDIIESSYK